MVILIFLGDRLLLKNFKLALTNIIHKFDKPILSTSKFDLLIDYLIDI